MMQTYCKTTATRKKIYRSRLIRQYGRPITRDMCAVPYIFGFKGIYPIIKLAYPLNSDDVSRLYIVFIKKLPNPTSFAKNVPIAASRCQISLNYGTQSVNAQI